MDSKTEFFPGQGLSFITITGGRINYLDATSSSYFTGLDRGMQAAYRLMYAMEQGKLTTYSGEVEDDLNGIILDVIKQAAITRENSKDEGARGVASGLLFSFDRMMTALAKSGAWRISMLDDVATTNEVNREEYERQVESNAQLVRDVTRPAIAPKTPTAKRAATREASATP